MNTTVLVPVDGSDNDNRALPAAAALATLADGELHLIRVIEPPIDSLSPRAVTFGALDWALETRDEMNRSVRSLADQLTTDTGRPVTTEIAEGFDVADVLVDTASRRRADLVVMATSAPGTLVRSVRGSVADRVMRESPRPVLLVPPRAADLGGSALRFTRVLVPLDGSELALGAIDHLLELKRAPELEYILFEVVTSGVVPEWVTDTPALQPYGSAPDMARARMDAEVRLSKVADLLRAHGATEVRVHVAESPDPAAAIARAVRTERADLVAMSTRGLGGLKRAVLGSVADKVVRESDVPVLLVTASDR